MEPISQAQFSTKLNSVFNSQEKMEITLVKRMIEEVFQKNGGEVSFIDCPERADHTYLIFSKNWNFLGIQTPTKSFAVNTSKLKYDKIGTIGLEILTSFQTLKKESCIESLSGKSFSCFKVGIK